MQTTEPGFCPMVLLRCSTHNVVSGFDCGPGRHLTMMSRMAVRLAEAYLGIRAGRVPMCQN